MAPPDTLLQTSSGSATGIAELVQSILTSLAILVGAAWAYFNYFKGRTFRERLEISVAGAIQTAFNRNLLHVTTKVNNVGLSKVPLLREGSGLRVFVFTPGTLPPDVVDEVDWVRILTIDVLEGHDWIEPGESLQDHHLFILPIGAASVAKIEVQVVSAKHKWVARCVTASPEEGA